MSAPVRIGDRLGRYRIVRLIGEGGFGAVYEVEHEELGRRAAAKVLSLDANRHPGVLERFRLEARTCARIQHPAIVQVFEFGQLPSSTPWYVMELLQGHTLSAHMRAALKARGRPLGVDGLFFIHELAGALTAAHEAGVVHRDIKPSNAMIIDDQEHGERIKLLDFGIAKLLSDSLGVEDPGKHYTRTGALLGTPLYMAPEQCRMTPNTKLDGQADVYALGAILYELFAGRAPFAEIPEPLALMMSKLVDELPPLAPRAPDAPPEIVALTMSMLERDPKQRPTMAEVKARLGEFLRVPAARRSGFLPEVTPPEKLADKWADKRADPDPELPPTESGPLLPAAAKLQPAAEAGAGDAPIAKPPLAVTSGTIMPPTPPEYSSGQLSKPAVSLSQQPTQRQWASSSRIRRGIFALTGASLVVTATIIVWPWLARRARITTSTVPSPTAAASQGTASPLGPVRAEPPPTTPTAAVRAEPPAAVLEAVAKPPAAPPKVVADDPPPVRAPAPTLARRPSKPRCTPAPLSASCISSGSFSLIRKHVIIQELARLNVRLCSGESLHLRHRPGRIDVLDAPSGLPDSKREQISYSLLGVLGQETQRLGDIYIRCAAP